jgi:tetratricopeptide (TPR) repeat protein
MSKAVVTESEIEVAEALRERGEFKTSLDLTQDMLNRAEDDETRMRLLFDVLYCSTRLDLESVTQGAIAALDQFPEPEVSRIFVNLIQAISYIALCKNQKALDLIDDNLRSKLLQQAELREAKYENLAYRGRALAFLARPEESLASLLEAEMICPGGKREADILIDKANCLMALNRYEDAYIAASELLGRGDEESATLALHYMADCRMSQGRTSEALKLYIEVRQKLPSRLVDEERILRGIRNATEYLERVQPSGRPS